MVVGAGHGGRIPVAVSTASVYPMAAANAFDIASRFGYDGVEVMVTTEPMTQEAGALKALSDHRQVPILSVHAPTLLLTQRVWGSNPWGKVDRSIEMALDVGADTVVLHPPFRWQKGYAEEFVDGVREREAASGIRLAVENMYPWRAGGRELEAYLPDWDPTTMDYRNVTLDLSHTATAGSDALAMATRLGDRLHHLHLADGSGSALDEHLVPGRGSQPCAEVLELLSGSGFAGTVVVEVSTRKLEQPQREVDLAAALAFAQFHLG
ncbi:MAG: sugar phosphate isomerase/epimerase family protein [Nostocoides sp.]